MLQNTLIIFDVDGTLVDGNKAGSLCFARCYQEIYHHPFPSINWSNYRHVTDTTIFSTVIKDHFGRRVTEQEVVKFQDYYYRKLKTLFTTQPDKFKPVIGAANLIEHLSNLTGNISLGIATGGWKKAGQVKLDHVKVRHDHLIFYGADGLISREDIIQSTIQEAEQKYGHFEKIVYVGDAVWDVQTTRNMGIPFIGIRINGDIDKLKSIGATVVLTDFSNVEAFKQAVFEAQPPKKSWE